MKKGEREKEQKGRSYITERVGRKGTGGKGEDGKGERWKMMDE